MPNDPNDRLIRIREVLTVIPVGKSTWWDGVRTGRFPAALRLGPGITVWRASDISALITKGID